MDFLLIMGIGTVVAIVVVANLPKSGHIPYKEDQDPFAYKKPPQTPAWQKDISEVWSTDELDYLAKLERHDRDPRHWPAPLPPPPPPKKVCQEEECY
jgi:hypothetical protein